MDGRWSPVRRSGSAGLRSFCNLATAAISIWSSRGCSPDCGKAAPTAAGRFGRAGIGSPRFGGSRDFSESRWPLPACLQSKPPVRHRGGGRRRRGSGSHPGHMAERRRVEGQCNGALARRGRAGTRIIRMGKTRSEAAATETVPTARTSLKKLLSEGFERTSRNPTGLALSRVRH